MLLTTRRPRGAVAPRTTSGALLCALLCTVLGAMLTVLGTAAPASAHAVQTDSTPAEGSVVSSAPREVTVTFSEEVSMSDGSIRVLGPDGKPVDDGKVRVVKSAKVERGVGLKSDVPDGTYTVAWKAVSADSHPVGGAFTFSVGAPSKTTAQIPGGGEDSGVGLIDVLYQSSRYAAYAGFILLVGGAAFVMVCWPRNASARRLQRLVVTGWLTLTAATLLMLLLRNSYTGTGQLSSMFDLAGLKAVLQSKPGAALASRLLLLGTSAVIISVLFGSYGNREKDVEERRDLALGLRLGGGAVAVGIAATWAMSEHASTGVQAELAMPVDVLHLLAVAMWLGGLAAVLTALHWGPFPTPATVRRFSQTAFASVLVLTATGLYQSWRQLGSFTALTGTSYGQLLMVKVGLVVLLVGIASISRSWVAQLGEAKDGAADAEAPAVREPAAVGANGGGGGGRSASATESGSGSGSGSGPVEGAEDEPEPSARTADEEPDKAPDGEPDEAEADSTARAGQLARQRKAVEQERRRKEREADPHRAGLRRSVLAEAAIAVVLLGVTTGLTNTEPGRTAELTQAGSEAKADRLGPVKKVIPFDTGGKGGKGTAELWITPGQSGGNSLRVMTKGPDGKPLDASEVLVALTLPSRDLGPISVTFEPINDNKSRWRSQVVQVPLAGKWKAAVTLRTSDIDQVTESRTVRID